MPAGGRPKRVCTFTPISRESLSVFLPIRGHARRVLAVSVSSSGRNWALDLAESKRALVKLSPVYLTHLPPIEVVAKESVPWPISWSRIGFVCSDCYGDHGNCPVPRRFGLITNLRPRRLRLARDIRKTRALGAAEIFSGDTILRYRGTGGRAAACRGTTLAKVIIPTTVAFVVNE